MDKASDMSSALAEQQAQPTLRYAAQSAHRSAHFQLPWCSFRSATLRAQGQQLRALSTARLFYAYAFARQQSSCCSQREEHTCRLLEAATLQAEEAGISDEEPDVQLALMAAEMRCDTMSSHRQVPS